MIQRVPLRNKMLATPLVANDTVALSVSVPAMYASVIVQVMVIAAEWLLAITTTSPSENVELGMVIEPPDPTCTYLPTSPVANVYDPVLVPTAGRSL